ncbi:MULTISPECIES: septal ring lytic transglycosylase RlpA family protein [Flavobacterium]|uniref:Probable endolytic peptidoglycan transglycosylase RlpA n=1 Tax=Flavobacterium keumense TaxID=1306518 RepID=A0ABY8N828_9FLAO|nr:MULTISPECIES: septal ring lytic transglycosylase RlpA family protein [Flavobacterium]WGK95338.1 septal ring lytic transglycosylase RlpA family protein [Flavobacterium keumense]
MKKRFVLLFFVAMISFALSQTTTLLKQKAVPAKDTIKKNKPVLEGQQSIVDSTEVKPLKFKIYKKSVIASYYADKFNGKRTTSGKKFSNSGYTAAHKKLPFGTKIRVTNESNGNSVIVEVTDRGPFVRSKEIDLTKRAFMEIAQNKRSGMMKVSIEIIEK